MNGLLPPDYIAILADVNNNPDIFKGHLFSLYNSDDVQKFNFLQENNYLHLIDGPSNLHAYRLTDSGKLMLSNYNHANKLEKNRIIRDWIRTLVAAILGGGFVKIIDWLKLK